MQTNLGTALILAAVPAFALGSFSGDLWRSLQTTRPHFNAPSTTNAQTRYELANKDQVLDAWQDTQSIIDPPFAISTMNNAEITAYLSTIPGLKFGSSQYVAAQTEYAATVASEGAFEANYKVISNNSNVFLSANLLSGFLHGELRAFTNLSLTTSDPFTQAILAQKANVLLMEVNSFETWYFNATKNNLSPVALLNQLTGFAKSFETFSQTFTAAQIQQINSGTISSSTFTYTPPLF
jgi:hypothetical protein